MEPPLPLSPPERPGTPSARAEATFVAALDRAPEERDSFVAVACAEDSALHREVQALLALHDDAGDFMDDSPAVNAAAEMSHFKPEQEGERIDRYKLLQEIGAGGFGTVWMAEQLEPVSRRVALKIIKVGMDTREVIARFEAERQALAMMDHPNIAQVFDAGATDKGRPFFVMELVKGIPITQFCDEAELGTRERLALFGDVCSAINHAHQKGVIHRDIKPSNVMITLHGEKPVAKVIDFGIAKATQGRLTDKTLFTRFEQFIGTPVYMSPEQAAMSGLDVDTRSDIYALGILLYELLTGKPPFDAHTLSSVGYDEMRRIIREVEPPKPSTRLTTLAREERAVVAKARRVEPERLGRLIASDLDWIVMKAIEKDRTRRYQTANDLAGDIQRFLEDKTITARPPSARYRFQKFSRRNKTLLRVAAGIAAVLVAGTVVSTWQAVRARRAEKEAVQQRIRADSEAETAQQNLYYAQMHLGQQAWREHRGLKHMRDLLDAWLPVANTPDRRGWEWSYLTSLPDRNLRTFTQSKGYGSRRATTVAWHEPSKRLAEGSVDGTIRIWDVDREQTLFVLEGPVPRSVHWGDKWLAWSPDGSKLAAACDGGTVHLWDAAAGTKLRVLQAHNTPLVAVAFSWDGTGVAAWAIDGTVTIWEAETGRQTAEVIHPGSVSDGVWSPDNKLLATGHEDGTVTFSGTKSGDGIVSLQAHADQIHDLAWSPDSTRIASTSASDFFVTVWDVASQQKVLGPLRHSHEIISIAWEPDGRRIATGCIDQTIKIWDAAAGREAVTLRGHEDGILSLAWGPDGRLASGGSDGTMKVWDLLEDQEASVLPGSGRRATSIGWSPDGRRLASAGDDGAVRIWDVATRREVLSMEAHDTGKTIPQFGLIRSIAWSPDGTRIASAGLDGAARIWDATSGREVFALPGGHGAVWSVAWSPDGNSLAAGSQDGTIRIAENLAHTPAVRSFHAHETSRRGLPKPEGVRSLAWSPQGDRLVSGGQDRLVKTWDAVRGAELVRRKGHLSQIIGVSWSPDGRQLASAASDFLVMTWDAATGQKLHTMRGHNDFVDAVRWSPDGSRLASAGLDNSVRIWDPRTGQETFVLRGTSGMFHDVSWNPDGARLAAASSDGQIWIWDATVGYERDQTPRALPSLDR